MSNAHDIIRQLYQNRTLVFGHRGAMGDAPMNTLSAFQLALEQGADGIELDVHLSRDGHVVVVHDFTVDHTTNGTGYVTDMTLAELKALDAGSWFSPQFAGEQIPTLDEVFEAFGRKLFINVEIKSAHIETDGRLEQAVIDAIQRHHLEERVLVSSFNPLVLHIFRSLWPEALVATANLDAPEISEWIRQQIGDLAYQAYHPHYSMVTPEMLALHHELERVVNVWTVNEPELAVKLRDWGVNGIITNYPAQIRKALSA